MPLSSTKAKVVLDTVFLFLRTLFVRVIQIPVFLYVSAVLGPAGLGLLKLIELISTLS